MNRADPTIELATSGVRTGVAVTPLWAVLLFTFLNSGTTAVVSNGVFFLTSEGYGFGRIPNYILGVVMGATYVAGALLADPLVRRLNGAGGRFSLSPRAYLLALMILMAGICTLPAIARALATGGTEGGTDRAAGGWAIWVLIAVYSPMSGMLWPVVESYISGGRAGDSMRRTVGIWNVTWAAAGAIGFWLVSPMVESRPAMAIVFIGLIHLGAGFLLAVFGKRPEPHPFEEHHAHPAVYERLLYTFRLLLPVSYVLSTALGPFLPEAFGRLGVASEWQTRLASAWLISRVAVFYLLFKWTGWHGRWSMPILGAALITGGFALSIVASRIDTGTLGLSLQIAGLGAFGMGMATIYTGALYYALEVGKAQVDAGGKHEAFIGLGYTVGPMLGLGAALSVERGVVGPGMFEPLVLGSAGLLVVWACVAAWRSARRTEPGGGGGV